MRRLFLTITIAVLVSWGCHKKSSVMIPPPPPSPPAPEAVAPKFPPHTATPEGAPIAKTIVSVSNLELAEMHFKIPNYGQCITAAETYLSNNRNSKNRDRAYFLLGSCRGLAADSNRDPRKAEDAFRRLISEHPESAYKNEAVLILGLYAQIDKMRSDVKDREEKIKKLSEELQVLKNIDLQRRPSRPKE